MLKRAWGRMVQESGAVEGAVVEMAAGARGRARWRWNLGSAMIAVLLLSTSGRCGFDETLRCSVAKISERNRRLPVRCGVVACCAIDSEVNSTSHESFSINKSLT